MREGETRAALDDILISIAMWRPSGGDGHSTAAISIQKETKAAVEFLHHRAVERKGLTARRVGSAAGERARGEREV